MSDSHAHAHPPNLDRPRSKAAASPPQRPRHQIKRSLTELSSPIRLPRHHHLHHHSSRRDRDRDDRSPSSTSAMPPPPRASLDLPLTTGATTPALNADQSRTASFLASAKDDAIAIAAAMAQMANQNNQAQVAEDRDRAVSRVTGLRHSLVELHGFSKETTRTLDRSYFSILEKLSTLQSTIVSMKELASMTQDTSTGFKAETEAAAVDIGSQIDAQGQFEDQQKRIEDLQSRIQDGRERAKALSTRVDVVRGRVEGWERADLEWQERTRKRLKTIWIISSAIMLALVVILVGGKYGLSAEDVSLATEVALGLKEGQPAVGDMRGSNDTSAQAMADQLREALSSRRGDGLEEDRLMRAFEEL